jgi:hypothetical protein
MCGEECEGAKVRGISDVDRYAQFSTNIGDLGRCGKSEGGMV